MTSYDILTFSNEIIHLLHSSPLFNFKFLVFVISHSDYVIGYRDHATGISLSWKDHLRNVVFIFHFAIKMLHKEWIVYLKRENKSRNFDQIKNYYLPRELRRYIRIDIRILEQNKDLKEKEKKEDDFIIVHSEREFTEKCRQNPDRTIHYLIPHQNHLLRQKSNGPISTLNKFIIRKEGDEESIEETEIFHKNNDQVLIISAEPGMGKSLILDHFTQNSTAENFYVKIILNYCTTILNDLKCRKIKIQENGEFEFVLTSLLGKTDDQEISLLKQLAKEEKLILMFDGLDEVNDYKQQVIQLIDALMRDCKIKKIVITTRNHLREELEDHFGTFSFDLNNFDDEDQKNFLYKYWRNENFKKKLNLQHKERATTAQLKQSAQYLITKIKSSIIKNITKLIGIPLQTKMLADIYFDREKDFSTIEITNYADLYHYFLETKIRIKFEEKSDPVNLEKLPKKLRQGFERAKEDFYSDHIDLSHKLFFNLGSIWDDEEIQEIIEYGVVVAFNPINETPSFLHQSFAEFFLAKSCLQKFKEKFTYDRELEEMLIDQRHFLIRRFLNDLMSKKEWPNEKNDKKFEDKKKFGNCCRENLVFVLKFFIQRNEAILRYKNRFLIIASDYGSKDIVEYLIEKGIDVSKALKYGDREKKDDYEEVDEFIEDDSELYQETTALIEAIRNGHKEIVQLLLKHTDIDVNQNPSMTTALIVASGIGQKEVVKLLLEHKDIDVNKNTWETTALIEASEFGHKEVVKLLLEHKDIDVNKQARRGRTALWVASEKGHQEIVQLVLGHKGMNVNQPNEYGETALMVASNKGHKEYVQFLLGHKDIKVNQKSKKERRTALIGASIYGQKEIVQLLLELQDIDVNQKDEDGHTALWWASKKGHKEVVKLLLDQGAIKN
jgi:ankyrin repeat protein